MTLEQLTTPTETLYLTEEGATGKSTIAAVALAAHPEKGNTVIDLVMANDGRPLGDRIRKLITGFLGDDWTVFDWQTSDVPF